jgi:hypothetical protein
MTAGVYVPSRRYEIEALTVLAAAAEGVSLLRVLNGRVATSVARVSAPVERKQAA